MRQFLYFLIVLFCLGSCDSKSNQTIEGDLYFKLIDFERLFDSPDCILTKIETIVKTVDTDTLKEQERKFYGLITFMVDNNLLRKPFIRIRLDNGSTKILFLDTANFKQFERFDRNELVRKHKKIRIKAKVSELQYDSLIAFNLKEFISVDQIDGKTYWTK